MKHNEKVFALIDINNCYVSCERFFNPSLNNVPVIVLSNNDGCAVARSNESKQIGIKMGVPLFQIQDIVKQHRVEVLSSNYALYAEMSRRFHSILATYVAPHEQEIYSIDECFLDLTSFKNNYDLTEYCQKMRQQIQKWIGLPVSIGIGRSKTEAKIGNHMAKKGKRFNGVCDLVGMNPKHRDYFWSIVEVGEVWGVGRKQNKKLNEMGIKTVLDLSKSNPAIIGKLFTVCMQRTVMELNGISCMPIDDQPQPKKQVIASRSFGERITELEDLKEAMSKYVQDALSRMRNERLLCGTIVAFVQSSPFDPSAPYYSKSKAYQFSEPTDYVLELVEIAYSLLQKIYKPGVKYKKCGIFFTDLIEESKYIPDLLSDHELRVKNKELMQTFESIQQKFGKTKIAVGPCYFSNRKWSMNRDMLSKNYFTKEGFIKVI
ncbi:Y-family DNA polymerase [Acinetobacter chinensis]|uniref:Y-family DNA polymerase n=1 Tax=Acinetobacter chinensis TaxID=2004650 RepID=A0A3B7LV66_9GAMM|nr:Y-family DNA polymerase [Acinetobacter chinensis]AXY56656.1 Y-family DNA polymerase [Acinetobacter chinensis]